MTNQKCRKFPEYQEEMQRLLREPLKERSNCLGSVLYLIGIKDTLSPVPPQDFQDFRRDWTEISADELQQGDLIARFDERSKVLEHIGIIAQTNPLSIYHKLNWYPYAVHDLDSFRKSIIVEKESYEEKYFRTN